MLKEKSEAYARRRPVADGLFAGATDAIGNNMFGNTLYAAQPDLVLPSISRKWAHGAGRVLGEWDGFFASVPSSLEAKDQSLATIRALLLAQTEGGLIPNGATGGGARTSDVWNGRRGYSMPKQQFARGLRSHPADATFLTARGQANLLEWSDEAAITDMQEALDAQPTSATLLDGLAIAYFERGG
jgi:hypothetical protein